MPTKEDFEELLARTSSSWVEDYNDIEGLNGRLFIKAIITRPFFKNVTLYSPVFDGEVTDEIWSIFSLYTLEEINVLFPVDVRTAMFKDAVKTFWKNYYDHNLK